MALFPVPFPAPPAASAPTANPEIAEATYLLERGRRFDKAGALLRAAIKRRPEDYRLQEALGCAAASRVASLSYAAGWSAALARDHAASGNRKAVAGRTFPTRDDGLPYRLTDVQLREATKPLAAEARAAFERAEALARTPAETADAAYLHGWGLRLLARSAVPAGPNGAEKGAEPLYPAPADKDILGAFQRALTANPKSALYPRALGDFYDGTGEREKAEAAYRDSLALDPANAALWYRLYLYAGSDDSPEGRRKRLDLLRKAARYAPGNAWPSYEEMGLLLKGTEFSLLYLGRSTRGGTPASETSVLANLQNESARTAAREAVAAARRGNAAQVCVPLRYKPAVPRWLAVAWGYVPDADVSALPSARFREAARALSGVALYLAREGGDPAGAEEAARTVIGFGERIGGRAAFENGFPKDGHIGEQGTGLAVAAGGYALLAQVYEITGRPQDAEAARAEAAVWRKSSEAFFASLTAFLKSLDPYADYGATGGP